MSNDGFLWALDPSGYRVLRRHGFIVGLIHVEGSGYAVVTAGAGRLGTTNTLDEAKRILEAHALLTPEEVI